jgi:hypothetical protein
MTNTMRIAGAFCRLRARLRYFDAIADVRDFLAIGVKLALMPIVLSRLRLPQLLNRLDGTIAAPRARGALGADAATASGPRLALYADFWLRRLRPRNPCLRRSLVLFGHLRRAGVPVTFCLGIRTDQPLDAAAAVAGHAWLELDGRVILDSETAVENHVTTFRYPPRPAAGERSRPTEGVPPR